MTQDGEERQESSLGAILGWGGLAIFAIAFGWYVGAPLIVGERWSDKQNEAIQLVKDYTPTGKQTLYDMIRAYADKGRERGTYIGEFNWSAMQRDGPEYQVTLLWKEGDESKVAVWLVNLKSKGPPRPQGNEAASLPQRFSAALPPKG
jgi:hypothetical protein